MSGFYTDSGSWIDTGFQDSDGSYRDAIGPNTENTEPPDDGTYGSLGRNREPGTTIDGVFWRRIGFAPQLQGPGIRNDPEYGWIVHPSMDAQIKAEQARRTNAGNGGIGGLLDKGGGVFALGAGMLGAIGMAGGFSGATGFGAEGLGGSNMGFFDEFLSSIGGDPYSGLGYSQADIEALLSGTYSGAEQTFAQSALQLGGSLSTLADTQSLLQQLQKLGLKPSDALSVARQILGGGSAGGADAGFDWKKLLFGNSGEVDSLFGGQGLLGAGLSAAPSLAAINYATNLPEPDISKLNSAYSSIDPNALALPYDIQTGRGRESLNSSLTSRGVMGSSFANQDMESYDTMRGLGRSSLLTSGASSQADIASKILAAQQAAQKNKLDLYGRSLLALSGGLNPARSGAF